MKVHNKYIRTCSLFVCLALAGLSGCKKLVTIDPPIHLITSVDVFKNDISAIAVLNGLYLNMRSDMNLITGNGSLTISSGLSADELSTVAFTGDIYLTYYQNAFANNKQNTVPYWQRFYEYIFQINQVIEQLNASDGLTPIVKQRLTGEAKFLRAFFHFYLVNLYGDVPVITTTHPETNRLASRAPVADVYTQITKDLQEVQADLSDDHLGADLKTSIADRTRPNKATATALLARVYLYEKKWSLAESTASSLINNSRYHLDSLNGVFSHLSRESIWQLESSPMVFGGGNIYHTPDANHLILSAAPNPNAESQKIYLNPQLYNSFETGDERKSHWINTVASGSDIFPFAFKYKFNYNLGSQGVFPSYRENLVVFRLAEQYLIRAEAKAELNNLAGAADDINAIRVRAGLDNITVGSQADVLNAVMKERRYELFVEFGHRWLDLKRTGRVNDVMTLAAPLKGATWEPYKALYPIPFSEFLYNPKLKGHQNPGYAEQ